MRAVTCVPSAISAPTSASLPGAALRCPWARRLRVLPAPVTLSREHSGMLHAVYMFGLMFAAAGGHQCRLHLGQGSTVGGHKAVRGGQAVRHVHEGQRGVRLQEAGVAACSTAGTRQFSVDDAALPASRAQRTLGSCAGSIILPRSGQFLLLIEMLSSRRSLSFREEPA